MGVAFLTQNKAKLCKKLITTLVFEKNTNYFAGNCQKSQKIVIITSTPGQFSQILLFSQPLSPGVDVMITIFCHFRQFLAKKLAFFSKPML
jgi:hypothetical protein